MLNTERCNQYSPYIVATDWIVAYLVDRYPWFIPCFCNKFLSSGWQFHPVNSLWDEVILSLNNRGQTAKLLAYGRNRVTLLSKALSLYTKVNLPQQLDWIWTLKRGCCLPLHFVCYVKMILSHSQFYKMLRKRSKGFRGPKTGNS